MGRESAETLEWKAANKNGRKRSNRPRTAGAAAAGAPGSVVNLGNTIVLRVHL